MGLDNELLIKINGSAKNFIDEMDRVNKKTKDLQAGLASVAKVSTVAFAALAGAIGTTVVRFSEFEKTFSNVQTLLDKGSFSTKTLGQGVEDLKRGILSLGAESGESFEILNEGLFNLISGGVAADKAMETLSVATKLAGAGATDTNTAVKALTSTLTSFGDDAGTAQEIAEKFFTAQKFGVTTVGELAREFNKVAGVSKNLGLGFDEVLASLSSLTADGAKPTAEAATQLKAALNSIILVQSKLGSETAAVRDALSLQNVKSRGLIPSLKLLKKATGGNISEMQRLVGSSEALSVVLSLTGAQSDLVATQIDEIGNASKRSATFQDALAIKQETTAKAFKRLSTSIDAIAVTFGEAFAPTINAAANALTAIAKGVSGLDKSTIKTIATITGIVTALTAVVAAVSIATLGYLKLKAALIAVNLTLGIGAKAQALFNLAMTGSRKAIAIFRAGMTLATGSVRGFAAATGIGLVIVALSFLITDFKRAKAVISGTMAAAGAIIKVFAKNAMDQLGGLGNLLIGIFTLDKNKIKEGFNSLKDSFVKTASEIGKESALAFNTSFDASIASSEAEERAAALKARKDEELKLEKEAELKKQNELAALASEEQAKKDAISAEQSEKERAAKEERTNIEKEILADKAARDSARRKQFIKDEIQHGKTVAEVNRALASDEVQLAKTTSGQLVGLTRSKNKQVKAVGQAASLVQIGIKTAEGAISAYSALAGIPIVGPALGVTAAAAVIAFGAEQAQNVLSAKGGGVVPEGPGGFRDRIPALLEPGEVVIPRALAPDFIQSVGRAPEDASGSEQSQTEVTIGFRGDAFDIIEQKLLERRAIGTGTI